MLSEHIPGLVFRCDILEAHDGSFLALYILLFFFEVFFLLHLVEALDLVDVVHLHAVVALWLPGVDLFSDLLLEQEVRLLGVLESLLYVTLSDVSLVCFEDGRHEQLGDGLTSLVSDEG